MNGGILGKSTLQKYVKDMDGFARGLMPKTLSHALTMMKQAEEANNLLAQYSLPDPNKQLKKAMRSSYTVEKTLRELDRNANYLKSLLPDTAQSSFSQLYQDAMRTIENTETRQVELTLDAVLVDERMSVELETYPQTGVFLQSINVVSSYLGLEWIKEWLTLFQRHPQVALLLMVMLFPYFFSDLAEKIARGINNTTINITINIHQHNTYNNVREQAVEQVGRHSPVLEILGYVETKRDALMVRGSPNSRGRIIGRLPRGSVVTILERCEDGRCPWWLISYPNASDGSTTEGWVYSRYIRTLD